MIKLFKGTSGPQKPRYRARPAGFLLSHLFRRQPGGTLTVRVQITAFSCDSRAFVARNAPTAGFQRSFSLEGTDGKLESIPSHRLGHRPNRVEPRAIKRRPKGHKLQTPRPSDEPGRDGRRAAGRSARTPPSSPQPAMMAMKAQDGEPNATARLRSSWKSPLTLPRRSMPSLSRNITIRSFDD